VKWQELGLYGVIAGLVFLLGYVQGGNAERLAREKENARIVTQAQTDTQRAEDEINANRDDFQGCNTYGLKRVLDSLR